MCATPSSAADVQTIIDVLNDGLGTMAMVNYPYATNFTANIPANPVKAACAAAAAVTPSDPENLEDFSVFNFTNIDQLFAAANIYYSFDGSDPEKCFDLSKSQE